MQQQRKRTLFVGCDQPGHSQNGLTLVCLDVKCQKRGLLCIACKDIDHKEHLTSALTDFLETVDNMRFAQQSSSIAQDYAKVVKQLRVNITEQIVQTKNQITETLGQLDQLSVRYVKFLDRLETKGQSSQTPMFEYDPSQEIPQINASLQPVIKFFLARSQGSQEKSLAAEVLSLQKKTEQSLKGIS